MYGKLLFTTLTIATFCFVGVSQKQQKIIASNKTLTTQVLVIGGGTGGTAAGIQSARMGAATLIIEPTPWLGGMLSAAGVTATDGNHKLPSGIWNEFREALYKHYGTKNLMTGWVSNTQFEPYVADSIFKAFAAKEKQLQVLYGYRFVKVLQQNNTITGAVFINNHKEFLTVKAQLTIDATDLGDAFANAGAAFSLGMEANSITQENVGIDKSNSIIQDLTYAAILKDYGVGIDKTIPTPANYNPLEFDGACTDYFIDTTMEEKPKVSALKMLEYGKLPNNKYMINWPTKGNDTYLNIIPLQYEERLKALDQAKQTTYRFIYFIQTQLGFKHLGLANDEFNTPDNMPYMPYHREGRRLQGVVRLTMRSIAEPFTYGNPLYRTGISVGDYPIDHHHKKNSAAPQHLNFYPIPSYNIPMGATIPINKNGLLVCDKGISVSNVVNGTTRLQPVVLLTGQAVGAMAAICVQQKIAPKQLSVRKVQEQLLQYKTYIMPYIDVLPTDTAFEAIQKIGATGILKGKGIPYLWANQTWFYPDSTISENMFVNGLIEFNSNWKPLFTPTNITLTVKNAANIIAAVSNATHHKKVNEVEITNSTNSNANAFITKKQLALLLNKYLQPFEKWTVTLNGKILTNNNR